MEKYNLKSYEEEDFEYLYNLKKECFKWYVEKIYGPWEDEFQRKFLQDFFEEYKDVAKVITLGDEKIGVFTSYVDDQNESVVSLFYIDKKYQGKGLGTEILEEQLMEDQRNGRNTILQVFKENPARLFYQKLGFKVYTETETHLKMRRNVE